MGLVEPRRAAKLPLWPPLTTASDCPAVVHELKLPVSKPLFWTTFEPGGGGAGPRATSSNSV